MAITLDIIADKVFKDVGGGYDKGEVDDFLNDILDEMEKREDETKALKAQVEELTQQLSDAKKVALSKPAQEEKGRYNSESYELILSKAQGVYEEIVGEADKKAEEIVAKANEDAAGIRSRAESRITDLNDKYETAKQQSRSYYEALRKIVDDQNASLAALKKILG